ncbi:MAG: transposase [Deltaproteobacteria bacterium]|nr:transposase [Deltaproteobacteria bacterium]
MQIILFGPRTLTRLSQQGPSWLAEWHFRKLLSSGYWSLNILLTWFADKAIKAFPAPRDKVVYVAGDGSHKNKRGKKSPAVQKTRISDRKAYFFGIKFVVLCVCWDVYRIPVDFRIVLPKDHPNYKNEGELFREMLRLFRPPDWASRIIIVGDAGFSSKDNIKLIKQIDVKDRKRRWGFVFAIARTWNMEDGKNLKNLVTHTPYCYYQRTWIPRLADGCGRKTFWVFAKDTRLTDIGDVTIVMSKKGPNVSPKKTKLLVTNLLELTTREILSIYQRRWSIEILFKELKSGMGLGEHQVTMDIKRIEKSLGIAIIAYLALIRARKEDIKPGQPWSIFQLKNNFTMEVLNYQLNHTLEKKLYRERTVQFLKAI